MTEITRVLHRRMAITHLKVLQRAITRVLDDQFDTTHLKVLQRACFRLVIRSLPDQTLEKLFRDILETMERELRKRGTTGVFGPSDRDMADGGAPWYQP